MIILPNVFISYKSEEYADANKLRAALTNAGITCWMAPESIPGGSDYAAEISRAIKSCSVFVLILSSAAQKSKHIARELEIAVKHDRRIMTYVVEDCALSDGFEYRLALPHFCWTCRDKKAAQEKLICDIRGYLNNAPNTPVLEDGLSFSQSSISRLEEKKVFELLREEATGNVAVCVQTSNALLMGKAYEFGAQVEKNISKAQYYYTAGAYRGDDAAKFLLARLELENQLAIDQCDVQIQQIIDAADDGVDDACIYLGNLFYDGKYVEQSYEKAVTYWKKAEERNNAEAQYLVAFCYAYEKGVPLNYNLSKMLAELSNQQGYSRGARMLGHIYRDGLGCPQDNDKAESYYRLAVERGDYVSEVYLGYLYENKKDYASSFVYYSLAADHGNARGMYHLAWAYRLGEGTVEDTEKAVEWFFRAIESGHSRAKEDIVYTIQQIPDLDKRLQMNLRAFELECYGVTKWLYYTYTNSGDYQDRSDLKDLEKAFHYIKIGSDHGDISAEFWLARAYSTYINKESLDGKFNDSNLAIDQYKKIISQRRNNEELIEQCPYDYIECCYSYVCEEILKNSAYRISEDEILAAVSECLKYSNRFFEGFVSLMRGLAGLVGGECPTNHALAQRFLAILHYAANHSDEYKLESTRSKENVFDTLINASEEILQRYTSGKSSACEKENIVFWAENLLNLCLKATRDTTKQEAYALFCYGEYFLFKSGFNVVSIPIPKSTVRIRIHRRKIKDESQLLKSTEYYVEAYLYGCEAARERLSVIARYAPIRFKKKLNRKCLDTMREIVAR